MLITTAPIVIPVNTANLPTESLAAEAVQRPRIPQPPSAAENPPTKNSTEFTEQPKNQFENNLQTEQDKNVAEKEQSQQQNGKDEADSQQEDRQKNSESSEQRSNEELVAEELQQVQNLRNRDREVRAHEQAHSAVGGNLAGPANLDFTTGPDGKRYATSGDVSIDISKVPNDPAASIRKFEQVQRAALAPANPSSQDLRVAARAAASANQSRGELNVERLQQVKETEEQKKARAATNAEESESLTTTQPGKVELDEPESKETQSLASPAFAEQLVNPVIARRQAAQLNQKIEGSGALDFDNQEQRLSLTA